MPLYSAEFLLHQSLDKSINADFIWRVGHITLALKRNPYETYHKFTEKPANLTIPGIDRK